VPSGKLITDGDATFLCDPDLYPLIDSGGKVVAAVAAIFAGINFNIDNLAPFTVGNAEGGVLDLAGLFTEYSTQQFFFGRELRLALGSNLSDEGIVRADFSADADDAIFIELSEALLSDVGNITGYFLGAELGITGFDLVFIDMDRGEHIIFNHAAAKDNGVLKIVAFPTHESDGDVLAEGKFPILSSGAIREDPAGLNMFTIVHERTLVDAGALIGTDELLKIVHILDTIFTGNNKPVPGVEFFIDKTGKLGDHTGVFGEKHLAAVPGGFHFHAGGDQRSLRTQ
jgi:hypothetical protein